MSALLMLGNVESASAQAKKKKSNKKSQDIHLISMWGGGGYSGMLNGSKTLDAGLPNYAGAFQSKFVGGGGGLLGFGYELHHKSFMFKVGPEFRLFTSTDKLLFDKPFSMPHPYYTTDMTQYYTYDKLHQNQMVGQAMLPILFGANFDEKYYFLAGVKVGYTLLDNWHTRGLLSTTVTDNMAVAPEWQNIGNHYIMSDVKVEEHPLYMADYLKGANKMAQGIDVAVSLEGGIYLNQFFSPDWQARNEESAHPWWFRLGAFVDYGMPIQSMKTLNGGNLVLFDQNGASDNWSTQSTMGFNSLHASSLGDKLGSLLVGVKFTASWQANKPKQPNPFMHIRVLDYRTGEALASAKVDVTAPGKKKPKEVGMVGGVRPSAKPNPTDRATGELKRRYAPGTYVLEAKEGFYKAGKDKPFTWYMIDTTITHNKEVYDHKADMLDAGQSIDLTLLPVPFVKRVLIDSETGKKINGNLKFIDRQDSTNVFTLPLTAGQVYSLTENVTNTTHNLRYGHTYDVLVSADGYHDTIAYVSDLYAFDLDSIKLRPVKKVRHKLILKNMYFATDKTDILPTSDGDLQILYDFLVENPKIRVLITGHTDDQGSDKYNQTLSEGRSASVKAVMVERGIDADRMETNGMGESQPIDTNSTAEGRQNNRRVEVTVLNEEEAGVDIF